MLPKSPTCTATRVLPETNEWLPASFADFLVELVHIRKCVLDDTPDSLLLYRGQRDRAWVLDSTFARSTRETLFGLKSSEPLSTFIQQSTDFHRVVTSLYLLKFGTLVNPSDELQAAEAALGVDAWFELSRRLQQYPEEDSPTLRGSNFLDWSKSPDIALYFANERRVGEGAVYILDAAATGKTQMTVPMLDILDLMSKRLTGGDAMGGPLLFHPARQLSYLRAKNQQAIYFAQMDLRHELEHIWKMLEQQTKRPVFLKLVLPIDTNANADDYLIEKGIHKGFVYPDFES